MNQNIDHLREQNRNRLIGLVLEHLHLEGVASATIPIPGGDRVIAIGTPAQVRALLADAIASQPEGATGTTGAVTREQQLEAIVRSSADDLERIYAVLGMGEADVLDADKVIEAIADLRAQLAHEKEGVRRWSSKLEAVWEGIREAVQKYSGEPCEGEPFDRLHELLSRLTAPASAQPDRGAAPMYQAQFDGEYGSSVWRDVTEAAYHTFVPKHRRIVYAAPVAAVAPSDAKDATVPDHSERGTANAKVHGPKTLMTDEQAFNWAWTELKKDLGGERWNAGDEVQSWAFFKYGWDHRTQLELQRYKAPATIAAGQEAANAGGLSVNDRTTEYHRGYQAGIEMGKALAGDEASADQEAANAKDAAEVTKYGYRGFYFLAYDQPVRGVAVIGTYNNTKLPPRTYFDDKAQCMGYIDCYLEDAAMAAAPSSEKGGAAPLTRCAASRDGECGHAQCPQLRDGEPRATGRHCPLDSEGSHHD